LHDEAVQQLALICQQLDLAVMDASPSGQLADDLARIRAATTASVDELRRFARGLRPPILDDLGLVPAVQGFLAEFEKQDSTHTHFSLDGETGRLEPEVELTCFRIVQESVHNAAHHARATSVTVTLGFTPTALHVRIEDDGVGFVFPASLDQLVAAGHLGLAGMLERARLIGASLEIQTAPRDGTRILLNVPLARAVGDPLDSDPHST
jgi:signal transduction histidine kinase